MQCFISDDDDIKVKQLEEAIMKYQQQFSVEIKPKLESDEIEFEKTGYDEDGNDLRRWLSIKLKKLLKYFKNYYLILSIILQHNFSYILMHKF